MPRFPLVLCLALCAVAPLRAQFGLTVQINGQAIAIPNGGSITMNAPAVGQSVTATVSLTYLGTGKATFQTAQIVGSTSFTDTTAAPQNLIAFQTASVTFVYTAADASAAGAQFVWPFSEAIVPVPQTTPPTPPTITPGEISLTLFGTAPNPVLGQVSNGGTTAIANGATVQFPATLVNASSPITMSIGNLGSGPATINSITATGAGFSTQGVALLPLTLNAGSQLTFMVLFMPLAAGPSQGMLQVSYASGSTSALLSGTGIASYFSYQTTQGGQTSPLLPNQTITFPATAIGGTSTAVVQFQNTDTVALGISAPSISGTGFAITSAPFFPLTLQPQQSASITISFTPSQSGPSSGYLQIGLDDFSLSATGLAPPAFQFTGASGIEQPFQQPSIGLALLSPYPVDLNGILTLTEASSSFFADPAVQFSSGGRQVEFNIPAGTLQAVFPGGATQIRLQSGTVAGTISISAAFTAGTPPIAVTPSNAPTLQLFVPSLAPVLLTASIGASTSNSLTIVVTGYTTTRSLEQLTFQLTPASGVSVATTTATVDVSSAAQLWFQTAASQNAGGQFTVAVPFTFTSSGSVSTASNLITNLSAVSVTATNGVGTSNKLTVSIP
jgi:hypothetical protein